MTMSLCGNSSLTVLEGIALSTDPNYKVLSSSYPWIARKVLTDASPTLRETLKSLLYKVRYFTQLKRLTFKRRSVWFRTHSAVLSHFPI